MLVRILKENGLRLFFLAEEEPLDQHMRVALRQAGWALTGGETAERAEASFNSRITYARENHMPTSGMVPWGREWISTGKYSGYYAIRTKEHRTQKPINPKKVMEQMADLYLNKDKTFKAIGERFGWDQNTVRRRLYAAGSIWEQHFKGLKDPIPTPIEP